MDGGETVQVLEIDMFNVHVHDGGCERGCDHGGLGRGRPGHVHGDDSGGGMTKTLHYSGKKQQEQKTKRQKDLGRLVSASSSKKKNCGGVTSLAGTVQGGQAPVQIIQF